MQVNNYVLKNYTNSSIIKEVAFLIYTMCYSWVALDNRRNKHKYGENILAEN